jgi:hypothetical protein
VSQNWPGLSAVSNQPNTVHLFCSFHCHNIGQGLSHFSLAGNSFLFNTESSVRVFSRGLICALFSKIPKIYGFNVLCKKLILENFNTAAFDNISTGLKAASTLLYPR